MLINGLLGCLVTDGRMRNVFGGENGTPNFPVLFAPVNVLEDLQLQYAAASNGASGQLQLFSPCELGFSEWVLEFLGLMQNPCF